MSVHPPPSWEGQGVTTKSGIEWFPMINGYKEKWAQDGNQTTILAMVRYEDSNNFLADMLGFSRVVGGQLNRSLPEQNPFAKHQWCTACDLIESSGNPQPDISAFNWPRFDWYTYQCTFVSPLWEYADDIDVGEETVEGVTYRKEWLRSTVVRPKFSGKNQIVPGNFFQTVEANPQPFGQTSTVLVKETRFEIQWMEVPYSNVLDVNIYAGLGKVNKTEFGAEKAGVPWVAQTALFDDVEFTPRRSSRGELTRDIKFIFRRKGKGRGNSGNEIDVTWNMLPRADRSFINVKTKTGNFDPYEQYEFRKLFSFF